jgi:hypothetical protein
MNLQGKVLVFFLKFRIRSNLIVADNIMKDLNLC